MIAAQLTTEGQTPSPPTAQYPEIGLDKRAAGADNIVAMHAHTASDRQLASPLVLSVLSAAAIVAVTVSIIGIVIIRPSARGTLG